MPADDSGAVPTSDRCQRGPVSEFALPGTLVMQTTVTTSLTMRRVIDIGNDRSQRRGRHTKRRSMPLHALVAVAGVSGSGKSSLAMGVLYAEGSRRYIEALSTYTRRRVSQSARAAVDSVEHVPAALALRQRPGVPGVRSTFGTSTELLNVLRLMFSRLGSHCCPNGHRLDPTVEVALDHDLTCPVCGVIFYPPGAESLAFNSDSAPPWSS